MGVKWIKIVTDIFDDEKILLIESLPDADSIIVIWFKLLCLSGKQNNSGVFMMSNQIACTDKMLATIFRRKESTVKLALKTFEEFGMIEIVDGVITIPNWGKHQSIEQIEARKEYSKLYQREYRAKQKQLAECNDSRKHLRKQNVNTPDKDIEEDKKENRETYCSELLVQAPSRSLRRSFLWC
jgi:predicted phage replisome organizer